MSDMSKNRQQRRALRSPGVPTEDIVATDPAAVGPPVIVHAPEFPGTDVEVTPVFDELWRSAPFVHLGAEIDVMDAMLTEPFEPWGLDDLLPLPIELMIRDLTAKVGPDVAWATEQYTGAQALVNRVITGLADEGEGGNDGDDTGSAGDADVADPAEGPAVVGGDGGDDPVRPQAG